MLYRLYAMWITVSNVPPQITEILETLDTSPLLKEVSVKVF